MTDVENNNATEIQPSITFADFLENCYPSRQERITDLWSDKNARSGIRGRINTPALRLFCNTELCNGFRNFRCTENAELLYEHKEKETFFVTYICSDCRRMNKSFSLNLNFNVMPEGSAYKYGEQPPFGVPIPNRVLRLFEADKALFFKGRQCENQGLGIAAFAYYRRVVEHQKNNIFDEIIKVSNIIGAPRELIDEIRKAKESFSFSSSLDTIKPAIPQAILINGQNPLSLLHNALSRGLHNDNDNDCLALAHSIRLVLTEMVGRLADLKKDDQELAKAVSNLMNPKS